MIKAYVLAAAFLIGASAGPVLGAEMAPAFVATVRTATPADTRHPSAHRRWFLHAVSDILEGRVSGRR